MSQWFSRFYSGRGANHNHFDHFDGNNAIFLTPRNKIVDLEGCGFACAYHKLSACLVMSTLSQNYVKHHDQIPFLNFFFIG